MKVETEALVGGQSASPYLGNLSNPPFPCPLFSYPYAVLFLPVRLTLGGQFPHFDSDVNCRGENPLRLCARLRRQAPASALSALSLFRKFELYFQQLARSFPLLPLFFNAPSFVFSSLQPLFAKHPGRGTPFSANLRVLCASLPRASKGALSLFRISLPTFDLQLSTVDFPSTVLKSHRTAYEHT